LLFLNPGGIAQMRRRHVLTSSLAAVGATALVVGVLPADASELVTAEVDATPNTVTVEQGQTANFSITLGATGKNSCGNSSQASVRSSFSLSAAGAFSFGAFGSPVSFTAGSSSQNGTCDIVADADNARPSSITASATTPVGTYTVELSSAATTTQVSNATNGDGLKDNAATTLTFRVVAPSNTAPTVGTASADASGNEGATLSAAGVFNDAEGAAGLTITLQSGAGTVTPGSNGGWSWSLPTTDQGSGDVVVRATDTGGLFVEDTFHWTAGNVAPQPGSVNDANGNEGDTLATGGSFTDVAADLLTITATGAGSFVDNGNGTWSWSLGTSDETAGSVTVTADDGDGALTPVTFNYSAINVDPTVTTQAPDIDANESDNAGDVTSSGAFSDVSGDSPLAITGTGVTDNGNNTWYGSVDDSDDAEGDITATADDGEGGSESDSFHYVIRNVAPTVRVEASDVNGVEGVQMTASGRFADVVADALTVTQQSGPGTLTDNGGGSWSWAYTAGDDETGTVVVQVVDGDGGLTTDSFAFTAINANPIVLTEAADATGLEGNELTTSGAFTDVPADVITITSDDSRVIDNGDGTWSWSLASSDVTSGTVVVTATDDDGGTVTDTFGYSAANIPPTVSASAADANGFEGGTLATSGSFDYADVDTLEIESDDNLVVDNGNGTWSWSLGVADQTSGTVVVTATDDDGTTATDTFAYSAGNVSPAVETNPVPQTGVEGATLTTGGGFSDVPADPINITQTSGAGTVTDNGDGTWSWSLATDDNVSGSVTVTADDGDGGTTPVTFTYGTSNVAPTIGTPALTGATGTACQTGNVVGLSFAVTDPGAADVINGTVNWGDGSAAQGYSGRTFTGTHSYGAGRFTITITASDDDGGAATPVTASVTRNYLIGAIQPPINSDGTSVFKYGSTVPVKVRITDCTGAAVPGLSPAILVKLQSTVTPNSNVNEEAASSSAADTTGVLRYDSSGGQYIYNLATKSLKDGDAKYTVYVTQGGATVSQNFGLRTK